MLSCIQIETILYYSILGTASYWWLRSSNIYYCDGTSGIFNSLYVCPGTHVCIWFCANLSSVDFVSSFSNMTVVLIFSTLHGMPVWTSD